MAALTKKSIKLTQYLEDLLENLNSEIIEIITPKKPDERGCQLSIRVKSPKGKPLFDAINSQGVIADWREPDVIRIAPTPLYNSFKDVYDFVSILKNELEEKKVKAAKL